jgi:chloramphenicol-sensitive protein RarD
VETKQVLQSSLGYFITPLVQAALGMIVLGDRVNRLQAAGIFLAAVGVLAYVLWQNQPPTLALLLAGSFSLYALVRKLAAVDSLSGLTIETAVLAPLSAGCLLYWRAVSGVASTATGGEYALLVLFGVITALPLLCFGAAARRLPLTTLSILQYIAPTLQFLAAVVILGEPFDSARALCFALVWAGVGLFTAGALRRGRESASPPAATAD